MYTQQNVYDMIPQACIIESSPIREYRKLPHEETRELNYQLEDKPSVKIQR